MLGIGAVRTTALSEPGTIHLLYLTPAQGLAKLDLNTAMNRELTASFSSSLCYG